MFAGVLLQAYNKNRRGHFAFPGHNLIVLCTPPLLIADGVLWLCILLKMNLLILLAMSTSEVPMAKANRMSTYCDITEYDLFLSQEALIDFQQIEEGQ